MRTRQIFALASLLTVVTWSGAGAAGAAPVHPKTSQPITLDCDNGHSYSGVINTGQSQANTFNPAHDLNSSSVLIPIALGEDQGTITNSNGDVVDSFTDPARVKGHANPRGHTLVHCDFTIVSHFTVPEGSEDPPAGVYTVTVTGTATGFVSGHK